MSTSRHSPSPSGHTHSVHGSSYIHDPDALPVDRPPSIKDEHVHYPPLSPSVLALLIPTTIFGLLARLGLQALVSYDGRSIFPLAYVQAVGCFIMGIGLALKEPFARFYPPLYTALTTGFCGSLTTFSGWQLDVFSSWLNAGQYRRGGLHDFIDGIAKTVFTFALSIASLGFGRHIADIIIPHFHAMPPPRRPIRLALTTICFLTYPAVLPVYFYLPVDYRHQATAALLFAVPGTLTRYLLSTWLNSRHEAIPLGTLVANESGTALIGLFRVLQSTSIPTSPNACAILQGLADGYCGCLTTVSTFVAELDALGRRRAWVYAMLSCVTGQVLLLVIFGSLYWTKHVEKRVTCAFE